MISDTLRAAEASGFEVRDLESLREHYALTLRHWVQRLEQAREEACRLTDDITYRIWRIYMAGSAHGFDIARLNLYQTLLVKPAEGRSCLPLTRGTGTNKRRGNRRDRGTVGKIPFKKQAAQQAAYFGYVPNVNI